MAEKLEAKMITWLGEDELHTVIEEGVPVEYPGPSFMRWGKVRFDKDKPKLIDPDKTGSEDVGVITQILTKTPHMRRFKVEPVKPERAAEPPITTTPQRRSA